MVAKIVRALILGLIVSGCAIKTVNETKKPPQKNVGFSESDFKDLGSGKPPTSLVDEDDGALNNQNGMPAITPLPPPPPSTTDATQVPPVTPVIPTTPPALIPNKPIPRIGLILTGGGAKTWAHIGVLKEIEKAKWPVRAIAGLEWGSVVAAVYAHQLSPNEVEWEMSKVKNLSDVEDTSETLFNNQSVSSLKIPFVCASLNVAQQQGFLLNRGQLSKLTPFCMPHPPLANAYKQSMAYMTDLAALAQHLKATGVKKVVVVNVLAQKTKRSFVSDYLSAENVLWVQAAAHAEKRAVGVDDVIQINLDDYGIKDLDKRREIIARGSELSYDQIRKLSEKYGL